MMASASHLELTLPPHHFTSAFNSKYLFWPSTFIFLCSSTGRPFLPYCSHTLLLYLLTHLQTAAVNASTRPKRALANKMLFFCVCVSSAIVETILSGHPISLRCINNSSLLSLFTSLFSLWYFLILCSNFYRSIVLLHLIFSRHSLSTAHTHFFLSSLPLIFNCDFQLLCILTLALHFFLSNLPSLSTVSLATFLSQCFYRQISFFFLVKWGNEGVSQLESC